LSVLPGIAASMSELAIFADSFTALTARNDVIHRVVIQRVNLVLVQTKLPLSVWLAPDVV
jgi:hypothetical protein